MEREAKTSDISIKSSRSDTGVFKAAVFEADLKNHDHHLLCGWCSSSKCNYRKKHKNHGRQGNIVLLNANVR